MKNTSNPDRFVKNEMRRFSKMMRVQSRSVDRWLRLCYARLVPVMKTTPVANVRILLVDDNRDGLVVRRSLLEELGYCVEISGNGEDALRLFEAARFDVVVTDYKMPRMNGAELIEQIRKVDPNARVILLSGFVDPLGLTEQNTGADTVVEKSAREPVHLVRAVRRLLNRTALRKPAAIEMSGSAVREPGTLTRNLAH